MSEFQKVYEELVAKHHIHPAKISDHKPHPVAPVASVVAATGVKKALLIGINYFGTDAELKGCHDDVDNMQEYLKKCGFTQFTVLKDRKDDRAHKLPDCPTRDNIIAAMKQLMVGVVTGDVLYVHYSGHGSHLAIKTKALDWIDPSDTKDGQDECICPVDFDYSKPDNGFIRDNELNALLVAPLPAGAKLRVCFDSCHSGSALDLPYMWAPGATRGLDEPLEYRLKVVRESKLERDVVFISGCRDNQTSADASFNGIAQGAMTWALLQSISALQAEHTHNWEDLVTLMRKNLVKKRYDQVPQLSVESPSQLKELIDLIMIN